MKTTFPKPTTTSTIRISGLEDQKVTREQATTTLRAYAFIGEPIQIKHGTGAWTTNRDIARPSGVTDKEAQIAIEILCHRMVAKLWQCLPEKTPINVIDCAYSTGADPQAPWATDWMIEIGDGWTLACSIESDHGYRGAVRWHAYNPEGDPIIENTLGEQAALAVCLQIAAYHFTNNYNKES